MATKARKKNISDQQFKKQLIEDVALGHDMVHRKSNYYEHIRTIYAIEKQRCLNLWDKYYPEIMDQFVAQTMNTAKEKYSEFLSNQIDIKQERVILLQEQAKQMMAELRGDVEYSYILNGKTIASSHTKGKFTVPVQIKNQIRKQLKEIMAEISKIQGDYAAEKIHSTYRFVPRSERGK